MNGYAAIGYAILAGKDIGLSKKTLEQLEQTMRRVMDEKSTHEAERAYREN